MGVLVGNKLALFQKQLREESSSEAKRWDQRGAEGIRGRLSSCILGKPRMKNRYLEVLKLEYDILCGSGIAMRTGEEVVEWFWITGNQYQVSDVVDDER